MVQSRTLISNHESVRVCKNMIYIIYHKIGGGLTSQKTLTQLEPSHLKTSNNQVRPDLVAAIERRPSWDLELWKISTHSVV